ncbi:MAG: restriction endonuclease [Selenomonadaceae bacterium]|nr:restriction endonuclease [Selenomonadaceae bacterium]
MAVYAYGDPDPEGRSGNRKFVYDSLVNDKISRFLWSWYHDSNLNRLKNIPRDEMTADEKATWSKGHRLLDFRPGDWVLHKNVPQWGQVTAARLSSEYFYQAEMPAQHQDGRQCFHVDKVITFARGDGRLHALFNTKLKVMGAMYQIRDEKEFYESLIAVGYKLDAIDEKRIAGLEVNTDGDADYFKRELNEVFGDLAEVIQRNYPDKKLEGFVAEVFRKIPDVTEVKENGSGWKTDFGADLIVHSKNHLTVVQVKSYVGKVWDTRGVDQLETAIENFNATRGILITTGESTPDLKTAIKKLTDKMSKKNVTVKLIAGSNFAKFVCRYGLDLLN